MRVEDLAATVAEHAAQRFAEKRGFLLPLTVGAMLPGIAHKAIDQYHNSKRQLDDAAHQQLFPSVAKHAAKWTMPPQGPGAFGQAAGEGAAKGVGAMAGLPLAGLATGLGGVMNKGLDRFFFGHGFGEKKDPLHMMGTSALQTFGKEMGTTGAGLLRDIGNKAMASIGALGDQSAREAILKQLKREDPVLAGADDKTLMEAYHTMQRFAPVLSTDKNAVRSFLRQAVMGGSGLDYVSIKLLADTERAITGDRKE